VQSLQRLFIHSQVHTRPYCSSRQFTLFSMQTCCLLFSDNDHEKLHLGWIKRFATGSVDENKCIIACYIGSHPRHEHSSERGNDIEHIISLGEDATCSGIAG
jgi:hypothetical protein